MKDLSDGAYRDEHYVAHISKHVYAICKVLADVNVFLSRYSGR